MPIVSQSERRDTHIFITEKGEKVEWYTTAAAAAAAVYKRQVLKIGYVKILPTPNDLS